MPVRCRLFVLLLLVIPFSAAMPADAEWAGRTVRDYLDAFAANDIDILYSSDLVRADFVVLSEPESPLSIASLSTVLAPYGLATGIGPGGSILVVRQEPALGKLQLSVTEKVTGFPIAGASVFLDGRPSGQTDGSGLLSLPDLEPGSFAVTVEVEGYVKARGDRVTIRAGDVRQVEVVLAPLEEALAEVVVVSSLYSLKYDPAGSHTFIDRELTTRLPDVGDDAVRAVHRLPGVANGGVSVRSHVRGGIANEQLVLFDGLRLYEPYHMKDFQSVATIIDQNAISSIDFYSAGYQVQYGDRMSGVIDMSMREPPDDRVTELSLSFFNASALSMGRFGGDGKGDWLATARRSNLDLIANAVDPGYGSPRFQDSLLHVGWELGDRTYFSVNYLFSYDKLSLAELDDSEQANANYKNRVGWLKAVTDLTPDLTATTILSATTVDDTRSGTRDTPDTSSGTVFDTRKFRSLALRQDWRWATAENFSIKTGFDLKRLEANYDYASTLRIEAPFDEIFDNRTLVERDIRIAPRGMQYAAYLQARWRPLDRWVIDGGARWDQQTYTTADDDEQISLRVNLLHYLGDNTELRIGAGRFYQAQEINELQIEDGVASFFPAQRASHFLASVTHQLRPGIELRLELYEKKYRSLMARYENVFDPVVLIPELQIDRVRIDADAAVSRGAEMMISGSSLSEDLLWWFSYTWSTAEDWFPDSKVRRSWDQPNTVKAGVNWDWNTWSFSAAATVHTGWPRTGLSLESSAQPDGSFMVVAETSPRNGLRFSPFNTLDARVSRRFNLSRGELTAFLEITNIYNQQNVCCTQYGLQNGVNGEPILTVDEDHWLPLVPSLGVVWQF